jgi:hypothetical protein
MKRIIFILTLLLVILGWSCQQVQEGTTDPGTINKMGKVSISISQAPDEITSVVGVLSRPNFEDQILILSISDSGRDASCEFTDIPIGMWHLKVDARDNLGIVRYSGETSVEVFPGQTSIVDLELLPTTGNIKIHVTWGTRCTPPPSGLVSWWPGDGTAVDIADSNNGTMMNGASFAQGKVGKAFLLDGINDYVRIPHSAKLNPTGSFTVEAWIYPTRDAHATVIGKWGDRLDWGNQRAWNLTVRSNKCVNFSISDSVNQNDSSFHIFKTPEGIISLNQWNHIAGVYNQITGTRRIYVNGVKVAERMDKPITIFKNIADVSIGVELYSPYSSDYFFPGIIDEVSFYNRALSKKEIKEIYRSGVSGKCKR